MLSNALFASIRRNKGEKREENKNSVHTTVSTVNNNGAKTDSSK